MRGRPRTTTCRPAGCGNRSPQRSPTWWEAVDPTAGPVIDLGAGAGRSTVVIADTVTHPRPHRRQRPSTARPAPDTHRAPVARRPLSVSLPPRPDPRGLALDRSGGPADDRLHQQTEGRARRTVRHSRRPKARRTFSRPVPPWVGPPRSGSRPRLGSAHDRRSTGATSPNRQVSPAGDDPLGAIDVSSVPARVCRDGRTPRRDA
jgi:hypothetical protein